MELNIKDTEQLLEQLHDLRGQYHVLHTHQPFATAIGAVGQPLELKDADDIALIGKSIPVSKYVSSVSSKQGKMVKECLANNNGCRAIFLRYHGLICLGTDEANALDIANRVEEICREKVLKQLKLIPGELAAKSDFYREFFEELQLISTESCYDVDPRLDMQAVFEQINKNCGYECLLFNSSDVVKIVAGAGISVRPMIDEMASLAGTCYECIDYHDRDYPGLLAKGLADKGVVFVKGLGAICAANSEDVAFDISETLERNCLAALICNHNKAPNRLKTLDAIGLRKAHIKCNS